MAYPFRSETLALRQRLLIAIGGGGLLGLGAAACGSSHLGDSGGKPVPQTARDSGVLDAGRDAGVQPPKAGETATAGTQAPKAGASGSAGGRPPKAGESGTAGTKAPMSICGSDEAQMRGCYTPGQMDDRARNGCGGLEPLPRERTPEEVAASYDANGCLKPELACDGCCNPGKGPGELQGDGSCCYTHCAGACCGRPLIVAGESRVAGVAPRADWLDRLTGDAAAPIDGALRQRLAAEWREDARMEHASIASFARFTLELLAFGAPAELVELAQRAALDEIAHARLCFGLAERYDGRALGPAELDLTGAQPAPTLAAALRAAFLEGCVGETQAALLAQAALAGAEEPAARAALARIAEDEARHAELAWRFVAFALQRDPGLRAELSGLLAGALAGAAPSTIEREPEPRRAALHRAGRLTAAERDSVANSALRSVIEPCALALLEGTDRRTEESRNELAPAPAGEA